MVNTLHFGLASLITSDGATTVLQAAVVTIIFAAMARLLNGVTTSGALAGAVVSFAIYASAGPRAFAVLVLVFIIAVITTRFGYSRKQKLGAAESHEGRSASQILANLGIAALACILFALWRNSIFLITTAAALAEAAADTASSEIGEAASGQARLITTFELVPAGTDGGITMSGTLAGLLASLAVAGVCAALRLIPGSGVWFVTLAGFLGMLLDSVFGAVLESRKVLNNDTVNLLGTCSAALIALLLARVLV
jgi:uncharacterized protein (TIGR00297 family)